MTSAAAVTVLRFMTLPHPAPVSHVWMNNVLGISVSVLRFGRILDEAAGD
ncbi:hypothetical protein GCM10010442_76550 [Kitasatospora kifunensis]|uniref:Uncharacterized protein n=1 Tax=Kitasatospora kifunensis TaxID=58351 RepID=A0A7W7VZ62_KITKI|nr:hypothetical protein [Kitasatospora kifunensis]